MINLEQITRTYHTGGQEVRALDDLSLTIGDGELLAIMGPSGSGKSTLLNIIGCLDRPTSGRYLLGDRPVEQMSDNQLARLRNRNIGFVFQSFNLLPRLTALQNVELPLIYRGMSPGRRAALARAALEQVGLGEKIHRRPSQLSGGEQQRVAIARPLAQQTPIILADEPTGNLDSVSGQGVMDLFHTLNNEGITIILVTHDPEVAAAGNRLVSLRDGRIVYDGPVDGVIK